MKTLIDLSQLTKPITKLIDVVGRGCGAGFKSRLLRAEAKAQADKIRLLSEAVAGASSLPLAISFKDANLEILLDPERATAELVASSSTVEERGMKRLTNQAARQQENLENVISFAARELENEETVSEEPLDEDWINRFFRDAADVSSEHMQDLWGRILAGEIKSPRSFSLRTLNTVRHLSQREANAFDRLCRIRILDDDAVFVINPAYVDFMADLLKFSRDDIFVAQECGLVHGSGLTNAMWDLEPEDGLQVLDLDTHTIAFSASAKAKYLYGCISFTTAGRELSTLVPRNVHREYVDKIAEFFRKENVQVEVCEVSKGCGEQIQTSKVADASPSGPASLEQP